MKWKVFVKCERTVFWCNPLPKKVWIRSFSGLYFSIFLLNSQAYTVSIRIFSALETNRDQKTSYTVLFCRPASQMFLREFCEISQPFWDQIYCRIKIDLVNRKSIPLIFQKCLLWYFINNSRCFWIAWQGCSQHDRVVPRRTIDSKQTLFHRYLLMCKQYFTTPPVLWW